MKFDCDPGVSDKKKVRLELWKADETEKVERDSRPDWQTTKTSSRRRRRKLRSARRSLFWDPQASLLSTRNP